jgi:hypothetical protein
MMLGKILIQQEDLVSEVVRFGRICRMMDGMALLLTLKSADDPYLPETPWDAGDLAWYGEETS